MSGPNSSAGARLRAIAARLNSSVVDAGKSLASIRTDTDELAARDHSLLKALLHESLRWHHRLQWQLDELLDRPLKSADRELAALLRVGLTQIQILRIPDHAAVSATVAATSILGLAHARGLVNAVLRRYLREKDLLSERAESIDVARYSHPSWMIEMLKRDWPEDAHAVLVANNEAPPQFLRINRARTRRTDYLILLEATGIDAFPHPKLQDAVLVADPRPVDELPGFRDGLVSVQDAAAQHAVDLMNLAPGQRVLDACAAPGGKAMHMLERCPDLGEVVALDHDGTRLAQIESNATRLGVHATLVAGDALDPRSWFSGPPFDRILVDAPCSATGVVRRHPDIKVLRRPEDIEQLSRIQGDMLDALWPLLKPGGLMLYVTCSVLKDEGLRVIEAFRSRAADAIVAPFGTDTHFQVLPGETNMDGFYYACLNKKVDSH